MNDTSIDVSTLCQDEQGEEARECDILRQEVPECFELDHIKALSADTLGSVEILLCGNFNLRCRRIVGLAGFTFPPVRFPDWGIQFSRENLFIRLMMPTIYHSTYISVRYREELDEYQPLVSRYHNNIHFMQLRTQVIRDLISRLPTSLQSQSTMVGALAAHSSEVDDGIQKKIEEFCLHYQSSLALNYYTKDMFFYQVINQILRQKREDSFYAYRHAIVDIMRCLWRPLPSEEDSVSLTLYRGQLMAMLEMDKLKGNVGELVVFSSFMSTTFNRSIAEAFSGHGLNDTPNLVSVILKIYLDAGQSMRPYALVPNSAEQEVQFSPGTKFLLMSCRKLHDNGRLWLIELKAISEEQQEQLALTYGETLMLLTSAKGWLTSVVVVPIEIT